MLVPVNVTKIKSVKGPSHRNPTMSIARAAIVNTLHAWTQHIGPLWF